MSVPSSESDWQPLYQTEETTPDGVPYQASANENFHLAGPPTQYLSQDGSQQYIETTLNPSFTQPYLWSDGVSPTSQPLPTSFQMSGAYAFTQDNIPQWQTTVTPYYNPSATQQAYFQQLDVSRNTMDPSLSQQRMLLSSSSSNQLGIAIAPTPPDSQRFSPFDGREQGLVPTSMIEDLEDSNLTSHSRISAAVPPNVASSSRLGPPKRKRSFSEADASSLASYTDPASQQQQSAFTRPKLGLVTSHGPPEQLVQNSAQEQNQYRNVKKPRFAYATPSPSQSQGPTSAPAEWLEGMSNNLNYRLGQSSCGPTINEWNQAGYLPGDRSGSSASHADFLQLPMTPTVPSPSAASVASSARGSTKRSGDDMFIGTFRCTICAKAFSSGNDLTHHQRYHITGRKPHICSVCDKDFLHGKDLRRHNGTHDPDRKKFDCNVGVCRKSYSRKDHLARHARAKHPARFLD